MTSRTLLLIALVALTAVLAAPRADAYLDPGTGSILLQSIVAAVAAVAVALRLYWTRLKSLFGRRQAPDTEEKPRP